MTHRNQSDRIGRVAALAMLALGLRPGEAAAAEGGLVLYPDPLMLAGLVILFAFLIVPVHALLLRPLLQVLDEREKRISGTRSRAEHVEREGAQILSRYESEVRAAREEAERGRVEALATARGASTAQTQEARAVAESEIERARSEVAAALEESRAGLRAQAEQLAQQAAARVLGRPLS